MEKFCGNRKHKTCCKEWGIVFFVAGIFYALLLFFPSVALALLDAMASPIGMGVLSMFVFGVAGRKLQVLAWENERPFNDGEDSTPDLYLFNPGTGAPWGLRAFMPAVETFSFCKNPLSWAFRQAKRQVAIVMDDGSVVFPWFSTAWISVAANAGSRIPIPQGYHLPPQILSGLQKRRDSIGNRKSKKPLTQEELDFLVFTDMIFRKDSPFCLEQQPDGRGVDHVSLLVKQLSKSDLMRRGYWRVAVNQLYDILSTAMKSNHFASDIRVLERKTTKIEDDLANAINAFTEPDLIVTGQILEAPFNGDVAEIPVSIRDLSRSVDGLKRTMQHHRKALLRKDND